MSQKTISLLDEVQTFLTEINKILTRPDFDVARDLDILLKKKDEAATDPHTTANTLLVLDFDKTDVAQQLMSLTASEYLETFIDNRGASFSPFFAFAKVIQSKDVYIKAKIRDRKNGKVFCVSFHVARFPFPKKLPYA